MDYTIYVVRNKINGKCYVGQSDKYFADAEKPKNCRFKCHIAKFKAGTGYAFHRALRKYGLENFELIREIFVSEEEVNPAEAYYIKFYNSLVSNGQGYNVTEPKQDADGNWAVTKRSEETRKKISGSAKGKTFSAATRKKLSVVAKKQFEDPKAREAVGKRSRKLTFVQVGEIRDLYARGGISHKRLGIKYGVSRSTVFRILNNESYIT